jgi:hypothetical protein
MRPNILKLIIFIAGLGVIFTPGCKKNEKSAPGEIQTQPPAQNLKDMKLARMFTAFKHKGSQKLKDAGTMTIDSAIWYLEGTVNFTYGKASQQTAKLVIDSAFITLALDTIPGDSTIALTEVWNQYSVMVDSIVANYQQIAGGQAQLMSVQVQRSQLTNTQLICKVTSIFSPGIPEPPGVCNFNDVDYWIWWNWTGTGGICNGPHNGQGNGLDAAQLIDQKIMTCMAIPYGNFYWTGQVSVDLEPGNYPNPNWGGVDHNYEEFLMYLNDNYYPYDFHGCLSPTECNFYLNGTQWVATVAASQGGARPDNLSFISIAIYGDELNDFPNQGNSEYLHHGPAYYGTLHWNPNPPLPL